MIGCLFQASFAIVQISNVVKWLWHFLWAVPFGMCVVGALEVTCQLEIASSTPSVSKFEQMFTALMLCYRLDFTNWENASGQYFLAKHP